MHANLYDVKESIGSETYKINKEKLITQNGDTHKE